MRLLSLIAAALLAGCISLIPATAETYRNVSSMELCRQYLTFPSINIHQGGRAAELSRRGESCGTTPMGAAAMQQQADRQLADTIQSLQPPPPTQPAATTQSIFINGKWVTCTTLASITTCR